MSDGLNSVTHCGKCNQGKRQINLSFNTLATAFEFARNQLIRHWHLTCVNNKANYFFI